jgi:hypothetical protein
MLLSIGGVALLVLTIFSLWACMPREGRTLPFINTAWEPYVGVAFTTSFSLCAMMIISAMISLFSV